MRPIERVATAAERLLRCVELVDDSLMEVITTAVTGTIAKCDAIHQQKRACAVLESRNAVRLTPVTNYNHVSTINKHGINTYGR